MLKLQLLKYNTNFDREFNAVKKLVIYNNPNVPITVIVDGVEFIVINAKTFDCHGMCFDINLSVRDVVDVIIEVYT